MFLVKEDEKNKSAIPEEEGGDEEFSIDEKVNQIKEDLKNLRLQLAYEFEKFSKSQIVPR